MGAGERLHVRGQHFGIMLGGGAAVLVTGLLGFRALLALGQGADGRDGVCADGGATDVILGSIVIHGLVFGVAYGSRSAIFMGMSNLAISVGNYWQGVVAERVSIGARVTGSVSG